MPRIADQRERRSAPARAMTRSRGLHPQQVADHGTARLGRGATCAQRERQQDRRHEQADGQRDVSRQEEREAAAGIWSGDCSGVGLADRSPDRPSGRSLERDPVALGRPARRLRARRRVERRRAPRPRGRRRSPTRAACPPGAELRREAPRRAARAARRSGSPARRRTAARPSAGCPRARGSAGRAGCGARSRSSPRSRSDRCRCRAPTRHRAGPPRSPGSPTRSRRRGPRGPRRAPAIGDASRARRGTAASSGGARPERHARDRARAPRRRAPRRAAATSAGSTSRRPTRSTGKCRFHSSAQSASSITRVSSSPIGRRSNACRWPRACVDFARRSVRPPPGRSPRTYARTIAGRAGSTRAPRPSSTSSNAGSTLVPPGATRRGSR